MPNFIVIFREPDGRTLPHTEEEISQHQQNWKNWFEKWGKTGNLQGGSGLSLNGKLIHGADREITDQIHRVGTEIVGGFLLLQADDLDQATEITSSCPIFEFGGYAEVREIQN
ncbi:YciI family protein [Pedobacter sp. KR3-3]|uniref:YciI family protein n=1 Tax=Pedobacter albus TaxID=3113905 RepID=A0ABU7I4R7_9SPHI|nr:YciI family protein [Pedobacter sp. KR3-3]MEE1944460.1 YciI family protein [Pedobacter sp. KR3-3]